jgi:hypothetical protein
VTALWIALIFAGGLGLGYSAALVRLPRTLASMTLDELKQLDDRVRAVRRVLVAKGKVLPNSPAPPVPKLPEPKLHH